MAGIIPGSCICCRLVLAFATRYVMGNFWYFNSNCSQYIFGNESYNDDYFHFCLHGGCGMRRPLFTDFGYNDYGIGGCTVQPYQPCIDTAAVCVGCSSCFMHYIHYCRICTESCSAACNRNCIDGWHAFGIKYLMKNIGVRDKKDKVQ